MKRIPWRFHSTAIRNKNDPTIRIEFPNLSNAIRQKIRFAQMLRQRADAPLLPEMPDPMAPLLISNSIKQVINSPNEAVI